MFLLPPVGGGLTDRSDSRFDVKWMFVKDIPMSHLRHITVANNDGKNVCHSRDTQELYPDVSLCLSPRPKTAADHPSTGGFPVAGGVQQLPVVDRYAPRGLHASWWTIHHPQRRSRPAPACPSPSVPAECHRRPGGLRADEGTSPGVLSAHRHPRPRSRTEPPRACGPFGACSGTCWWWCR
jgi:hypothetical protein